MNAAIDAGSNTLRLLIGETSQGRVSPHIYQRRITRLAGGFTVEGGLSPDARERTLLALREFAATCRELRVNQIKAVGTAAFRRACNGVEFAQEVRCLTGIPLEIISGEQEANYTLSGVLSALDPLPRYTLVIDIGGGSTEFVLCSDRQSLWATSIPLGVVRLTEDYTDPGERAKEIEISISQLSAKLHSVCEENNVDLNELGFVGTAGTVTTLAALDMKMAKYDWQKVNNYTMTKARLQQWYQCLLPMTIADREGMPGMEQGRGDLIIAGLEIVLAQMKLLGTEELIISDFGILEGVLLSLARDQKS